MLGGALAPLISVALLAEFGSWLAVALYVSAALAVTLVAVLLAPETARRDLRPAGRPEEAVQPEPVASAPVAGT